MYDGLSGHLSMQIVICLVTGQHTMICLAIDQCTMICLFIGHLLCQWSWNNDLPCNWSLYNYLPSHWPSFDNLLIQNKLIMENCKMKICRYFYSYKANTLNTPHFLSNAFFHTEMLPSRKFVFPMSTFINTLFPLWYSSKALRKSPSRLSSFVRSNRSPFPPSPSAQTSYSQYCG